MTKQKIKKFNFSPTLALIWLVVAFSSALVTWLILIKDDAKIYRAGPSSPIPQPSDKSSSASAEQQVNTPLFQQSKLAISLNPTALKMGIIVTHLGLQHDLTQHALTNLPAYTATSFSPYTHDKNSLFKQATAQKHEIMIDVPMTFTGDEVCDGGPCAIEANLSAADNYKKIKRILAGTKGCIGLNCFDMHKGAKQLVEALIPQFKKDPFLLIAHLNNKQEAYPASVIVPMSFKEHASEEILIEQLTKAEKTLRTDSPHIFIGRASPMLIQTLQKWGKTLNDKNIQLVPLSSYVQK